MCVCFGLRFNVQIKRTHPGSWENNSARRRAADATAAAAAAAAAALHVFIFTIKSNFNFQR